MVYLFAFLLLARTDDIKDCRGALATKPYLAVAVAADKEACEEIKVGDTVTVNDKHLIGLRRFQVRRISDKKWAIGFSPKFSSKEDKSEEFHREWLGTVQSCFNIANRAMTGPNGEELIFELVENKKIEHKIQIERTSDIDMFRFSPDVKCPVILHEFAHLGGFVDEYKETTRQKDKYLPSVLWDTDKYDTSKYEESIYNCRVVPKSESLMKHQDVAFQNTKIPGASSYCVCKLGSKNACFNSFNSNDFHKGCPQGWEAKTGSYEIPIGQLESLNWFSKMKKVDLSGGDYSAATSRVDFETGHASQSLLRPGYFKLMTRPYCTRYLKSYLRCSQWAYRSDFLKSSPSCKQVPPECAASDDWVD